MRWRPKSNRGKSPNRRPHRVLRLWTLAERPRASGGFGDEHFDKLFLRPSPIGAAPLDADRLLGRPPLTRAPVHDDLDVLPSGENASNLVFEMGIRPTDDDAGHPRAFSSPRVCGGDLQQKRGEGFQRYGASRRGRRTVDLSPRWIAVSVDCRVWTTLTSLNRSSSVLKITAALSPRLVPVLRPCCCTFRNASGSESFCRLIRTRWPAPPGFWSSRRPSDCSPLGGWPQAPRSGPRLI